MRPGLLLLLAFAAVSAALMRLAADLAPWDANIPGVGHHYEYLTEGFLSGHTYLSLAPAPDLLALADPYKPGQVVSQRLLDASLYHGKYYLYYGPAPAVLLMLPWRLGAGRELPQRLAVAFFAAGGLAGLALLLASVRRSLFPQLAGGPLAGAFLVAVVVSWLPVVVRRPLFWELPIVAAVAFLWWALYFLWRFLRSGRAAWAAATGAALAFLIGSRITYVFTAGLILCLLPLAAGPRAPRRPWAAVAGAAGLVACGGLALLAYNQARFGRWLEFGQSYQLWGDEYRHLSFLSPRYAAFNARMYLLSGDAPSPYFPFVRPSIPADGPEGYMGVDELYGALLATPVFLAGLAALAWGVAGRPEVPARALRVVLAAATGATVLAAGVLLCWGGACSRYVAELWSGWSVVAGVGVLVAFGCAYPGRRAVRALVAAAAVWSAAFVSLASFDYNGIMRSAEPRLYAALARILDYPSLWWARARGLSFGPVELAVRLPPFTRPGAVALLESGRRDKLSELRLVRGGPGSARLELVEDGTRVVLASGPLPAGAGVIRVRVGAPWLFPPAAHPYWDGASPDDRAALQQTFTLDVAGAAPRSARAASEEAEELEPRAARADGPQAFIGWVESVRRADPPRG